MKHATRLAGEFETPDSGHVAAYAGVAVVGHALCWLNESHSACFAYKFNRRFAPFHSSLWPWVANPQKALRDQNKQTHIQTSWEFVVHWGIHRLCDVFFFCCLVQCYFVLCCCVSSLHTQHIATSLCVCVCVHAACYPRFTLSLLRKVFWF